jgi:hypothetical protein
LPTTLVGLLLFVAFLTPGACYTFRREANEPSSRKEISVLRETSRYVGVSLLSDSLAICIYVGLRALAPRIVPDPSQVAQDPQKFYQSQASQSLVWGIGLLGLACLIATVLAAIAESSVLDRLLKHQPLRWLFRQTIKPQSAWSLMFTAHKNDKEPSVVYLECNLTDGAYVAGYLWTYSPDADETQDRELTLSSPIFVRDVGSTEVRPAEVGSVVVSARCISYLTVSYVSTPDEAKLTEIDNGMTVPPAPDTTTA